MPGFLTTIESQLINRSLYFTVVSSNVQIQHTTFFKAAAPPESLSYKPAGNKVSSYHTADDAPPAKLLKAPSEDSNLGKRWDFLIN